jgi:hypothetical protein
MKQSEREVAYKMIANIRNLEHEISVLAFSQSKDVKFRATGSCWEYCTILKSMLSRMINGDYEECEPEAVEVPLEEEEF